MKTVHWNRPLTAIAQAASRREDVYVERKRDTFMDADVIIVHGPKGRAFTVIRDSMRRWTDDPLSDDRAAVIELTARVVEPEDYDGLGIG